MRRNAIPLSGVLAACVVLPAAVPAVAQWVTRDHRWPPRGAWNRAIRREHPQLYREFNGIDFGHAHLAETLLRTQDEERVEQARLKVLDLIFSSPSVPPDEEQVAPTLVRMVWETQRAFNWAHTVHRSLYDRFASDRVAEKEAAHRKLLANYLKKPEAITSHWLDHHRKLWSFPESKAFRTKFPKFNTQIWAYHWLQAAVYDVQLQGDAQRQRELMPKIAHDHGYLRRPPVEWPIYLHRNHDPEDRFANYRGMPMGESQAGHGMKGHGMSPGMIDMGPRPPSAIDVLEGRSSPARGKSQPAKSTDDQEH